MSGKYSEVENCSPVDQVGNGWPTNVGSFSGWAFGSTRACSCAGASRSASRGLFSSSAALSRDGFSRILRRVKLALPRRSGRFRGSGIEARRLRRRRRARRLRRLVGRLSDDLFVIGGAGSVVGGLQVDRSRRRRRLGLWRGIVGLRRLRRLDHDFDRDFSRHRRDRGLQLGSRKSRKTGCSRGSSKAPKSANPRLVPGRGKQRSGLHQALGGICPETDVGR